jgi:hypothetical protein
MMDLMSAAVDLLGVYLHLATASQRRRRLHVRDRLLVLAGALAAKLNLARVAAYCRHLVLEHNPQHLVRRWPTMADALEDADFLHFLRHLQRRYPPEKAERLLDSLGIERGSERAAYYTDEEYAAALLGTSPKALSEMFGQQ